MDLLLTIPSGQRKKLKTHWQFDIPDRLSKLLNEVRIKKGGKKSQHVHKDGYLL